MGVAEPIATPRGPSGLAAQAQAAELLRWCSHRLEGLVADVERLRETPEGVDDTDGVHRRRRHAIATLRRGTRVMQEKLELAERAIAQAPVAQHGLVLAAMELRVTIVAAIDVARNDRLHPGA